MHGLLEFTTYGFEQLIALCKDLIFHVKDFLPQLTLASFQIANFRLQTGLFVEIWSFTCLIAQVADVPLGVR